MGSTKKVTVGHKYYMNIHFAIGHEGINELYEIHIGDRVAWAGELIAPGTAVIDQEKLFGGEKREGGVAGLVDFMPGFPDQAINPALAAAIAQMTDLPVPAYRGITTMFFRGLDGNNMDGTPWQTAITADPVKVSYSSWMKETTGTSGGVNGNAFLVSKIYENYIKLKAFSSSFYWSAMNPYFKLPKFLVGRRWKGWYPEKAAIGPNANPAHIIYECLTNKSWGLGYPPFDIDDTSFRAAADRFASEGFGLSLQWTNQTSIDDFLSLINEHVNATLVEDRDTGLFRLILVRADYVPSALLQLDETNCTVEDFQRKTFSETVNEVVVSYTRLIDGETDTIVVQDLANFAVQGKVNSQKLDYPGITEGVLAARVASRDLQTLSKPVAKVTVIANRAASRLYPGQVFSLTWARLGIINAVFRVGSMDLGNLQNNQIRIEAVEDVFGLPTNTYAVPQPIGWVEPSRIPQPVTEHRPFELSYYEVYTRTTEAERAAWAAGTGIFAVSARKPTDASIEVNLYDDTMDVETGDGEFTPVVVLSQDAGPLDTTLHIDMTNVDLYEFVNTGLAWLDDELINITAINTVTGTLTVTRGAVDTVPTPHAIGAKIWAYLTDSNVVIDDELREAGETIQYKLLPETIESVLRVENASTHSYQMINRLALPYPPGNVKLNGAYFPDVIAGLLNLTWAHRDRTQQLADVTPFTAGNIGPETGVTYEVDVFDENDFLLKSEVGLTGTAFNYTTEIEDFNTPATARSGIYELVAEHTGEPLPVDYGDVVSIMNFDGENEAVTADDEAIADWTFHGGAMLTDDTPRFGSAALRLNGGDWLTSVHPGFAVGLGDFTVEMWFRKTGTGGGQYLFDVNDGNSMVIQIGTNGRILYYDPQVGINHPLYTTGPVANDYIGQWVHVAVSRKNGVLRAFFNGVMWSYINSTREFTGQTAFIGRHGGGQTSYDLVGDIDGFRFTREALYAADFTVPTAPPSIPDPNQYSEPAVNRLSSSLRVVLRSERAGLESWQEHEITVQRAGYGMNYGMYV